MEEAFEDKIKDIGAMLGITEIPDSITDIIGSFIGSNNTTSDPENESKICPNYEQEKEEFEDGLDIGKIMEFVSRYQSAKKSAEQDQNIQLLRALGPFLSKKKRKKIKNCEKMLTIIKMI